MTDAVTLEGVTKRWGALTVLDNVDLTVEPGAMVGRRVDPIDIAAAVEARVTEGAFA